MSSYGDFLRLTFIAAGKVSTHKIDTPLATHVADASQGPEQFRAFNQISASLLAKHYPQMFRALASRPVTPEEIDAFGVLLHWLSTELTSWTTASDSALWRMKCLLLLIAEIDREDGFLAGAPDWFGKNPEVGAALADLIEATDVVLRPVGFRPAPELVAAIAKFNAADACANWKEIDEWGPHTRGYFFPKWEISRAAQYLARHYPEKLVFCLDAAHGFFKAMNILQDLDRNSAIQFASRSSSLHARFAALMRTRSIPGDRELAKEVHRAMITILLDATRTPALWSDWMHVFNRIPDQYPALQAPLGEALAQAPGEAFSPYLEAMELSQWPGDKRACIARCMEAFRAMAPLETRREMWSIAFKRWSAWNYRPDRDDGALIEPLQSSLDYPVVGYLKECLTKQELDALLASAAADIAKLGRTWSKSSTQRNTEYHRRTSRQFLIEHARDAAANDWLPPEIPEFIGSEYDRVRLGFRSTRRRRPI